VRDKTFEEGHSYIKGSEDLMICGVERGGEVRTGEKRRGEVNRN